ncbi:MAG: hypothetical protein V9E83_12745 [Baekduia sp.]
MPGLTVRRTIVKSQPEVWSEVSDIQSLARHLGAFGEISISRVTPETTVAWEGDRARGTVTLERSGWGTKVTVTAEAVEDVAASEAVAEVTADEAPEQSVSTPITPECGGQSVSTPIPHVRWWQRLFRRERPVAETPEPAPPPPPPAPEPPTEPDPIPEPVFEAEEAAEAEAVIGAMLDHLSAAHHRPFSRG